MLNRGNFRLSFGYIDFVYKLLVNIFDESFNSTININAMWNWFQASLMEILVFDLIW